MKKKLKLSDSMSKLLLIECGTCTNIAQKCNLSQVTISKAINGFSIGYKARSKLEKLIKSIDPSIKVDDIFKLISED
jgi:hypothetical protein